MSFKPRFRTKLEGQQMAKRTQVCLGCRSNWPTQKPPVKVCVCGSKKLIVFGSKREFHRAMTLFLLQDHGKIEGLTFHNRHVMTVHETRVVQYAGREITLNETKKVTYIDDAAYIEENTPITEDTKDTYFIDDVAKYKMQLYEAVTGTRIRVPQRKTGTID